MNILAIDTSSAICSVALTHDNKVDVIEINNGKTHSENLMPIIDNIVRKNNFNLNDLDMFAVVVGPGSFTGIRIGIATIKPMAEFLNKKIVPVTSLEALARNETIDDNENIVSLIDARNNQVYCGIFDKDYNTNDDCIADDINVVLDKISSSNLDNIIFNGNGSVLHEEIIKEKLKNKNISFSDNNDQTAKNVAMIAMKKKNEGILLSADEIIPKYFRKSQAERLKKND